MRTLMVCALNPGTTVRKSDVAELCNASENHLGQVIRLLSMYGFVDARRGRLGGMELGRPAQEITVGKVFRVFERDHPFAECFDKSDNTCPLVECCWLRPALTRALDAFYETLDEVTLQDLVDGNRDLDCLLSLPAQHMRLCGQGAARQ